MKLETGGLQLSLHCFLGNQSYGDCFNFSNTLKHTFFFTKTRTFFFKYRPPCRVKCCLLIIFAWHFCFRPDNLGVVPCFFLPHRVQHEFGRISEDSDIFTEESTPATKPSRVRAECGFGRFGQGESCWEVYKTIQNPTFGSQKKESEPFGNNFLFSEPTTPKLSENLLFVVFGTSFQTTNFFISSIKPSAE